MNILGYRYIHENYDFIRVLLSLVVISCFISCSKNDDKEDIPAVTPTEISVNRVYGDGTSYCAFTSLLKRDGRYYLAFREGMTHVSEGDYGVIKILVSDDGNRWETVQTVKLEGVDLRDPNLSIMSDGNILMICGGRSLADGGYYTTKTYYSKECNGVFSDVNPVNIPADINDKIVCWLWRLTWCGDEGFGVAYRNNGQENKCTLLKTTDGINYSFVSELETGELINETRVQFLPDKTMIALMRSANNGYMGESKPPYTDWSMKKLDIYLAGQEFIITDDGIICASRLVQPIAERTALWYGSLKGDFQWCYILPSSGKISDTAYAGMLDEGNMIWVSYYSMHETINPCIYLAKIPKVIFPFYKK